MSSFLVCSFFPFKKVLKQYLEKVTLFSFSKKSKTHSLYQSLYGSSEEVADAYEAALGAVMQEEIVQHIWME